MCREKKTWTRSRAQRLTKWKAETCACTTSRAYYTTVQLRIYIMQRYIHIGACIRVYVEPMRLVMCQCIYPAYIYVLSYSDVPYTVITQIFLHNIYIYTPSFFFFSPEGSFVRVIIHQSCDFFHGDMEFSKFFYITYACWKSLALYWQAESFFHRGITLYIFLNIERGMYAHFTFYKECNFFFFCTVIYKRNSVRMRPSWQV